VLSEAVVERPLAPVALLYLLTEQNAEGRQGEENIVGSLHHTTMVTPYVRTAPYYVGTLMHEHARKYMCVSLLFLYVL
jgi:hypothetical protein